MDQVSMELACRVCLQVDEFMVYIYEEVDDFQTDLCTLLNRCGDMVIDKNDVYPKYLCKDCTSDLLIAAKFREKCIQTQQLLDQLESNSSNGNDQITIDLGDIKTTDEVLNQPTVIDSFSVEHINNVEQEAVVLPENIVALNTEQSNSSSEFDHDSVNDMIEYTEDDDESTKMTVEDSNNESLPYETQYEAEKAVESIAGKRTSGNDSENHSKYICDICGASFMQAMNLRRHMDRMHMPNEIYTCVQCQHCFLLPETYESHYCESISLPVEADNTVVTKQKKRATTDIKTEHYCIQCSKKLQSQFALEMHMRSHTGERPFQCSNCDKSFKTKSALATHLKRHAGRADYKCPHCDKTFVESSNLKCHIRSHTGEKPHSCTVCGKSFARVFLLKLHMRTHTGEKPYQCEYCERKFAQLCDLRSHERTHTGDKRHQCPVCLKTFVRRAHMLSHAEKHASFVLDDANIIVTEENNEQTAPIMDEAMSAAIALNQQECFEIADHSFDNGWTLDYFSENVF